MCVFSWVLWTGLTYVAQQNAGSRMAMLQYLAYFNLPVRLPEFAIGMWLASAWSRRWPVLGAPRQEAGQPSLIAATLGPLLVGVGLFALLDPAVLARLASPFGHIYLVGWCVLGVMAVRRWPGAAWLAGGGPILRLAAASYSIYLLHQPLLGAAERWFPGTFSPPTRFVVLLVAVGVLCYEAALALDHIATRLAKARFGS
jgi:peptidoglycan/LPS O-acetylase OafA/YrhL